MCYSLVYKHPGDESVTSKFQNTLDWIRGNWKSGGGEDDVLAAFCHNVRLEFPISASEVTVCKEYLEHYLNVRSIPGWVLQSDVDTENYDQLFEEYFSPYYTQNLLNIYNSGTIRKSYLISTHVYGHSDSCVGFVCFQQTPNTEDPCNIQGIITCPFYRKVSVSRAGVLGSANTILRFLEKRRDGRQVVVSPISSNPEWHNRLSQLPFFVNSSGARLTPQGARLLQLRAKRRERKRRQRSLVVKIPIEKKNSFTA
jgi:hypothetical protein